MAVSSDREDQVKHEQNRARECPAGSRAERSGRGHRRGAGPSKVMGYRAGGAGFRDCAGLALAAIDEGIEAEDEARVARHDDVVALVRSWGGPDGLPMPRCG